MSEDPVAFRVFNEIAIIDQLARTRVERVLPGGLTIAQFSVLNHFVRLGGERSPARLARAFQVTKQTMTSTLGRLERAGLVEVRADATDGRAKVVAITEAGRAARQACLAAMAPVLDRFARLIGADALAALAPELARIRQLLDAERD